jgi:hypothetical protein
LDAEYEIRHVRVDDEHAFHLVGSFHAAAGLPLRRAVAPHLTGGKRVAIECGDLCALAPEVLDTLVAFVRLAGAFETPLEVLNLSVDTRRAGALLPNEANGSGSGPADR